MQQESFATADLLNTVAFLLSRLDTMMVMMTMIIMMIMVLILVLIIMILVPMMLILMMMILMMNPCCCLQVFVLPSSVSLKTGALCEVTLSCMVPVKQK